MTASEDERADVTGAESPILGDLPEPVPDAEGDSPAKEASPGKSQKKPAKKSSFWKELPIPIGIGSPPEYDLVKRIIAVGGQTVACCDSQDRVTVNGKPLNEPYIYWEPGTSPVQHPFAAVTIPKGDLWVMGVNRNDSLDSRF